MENPAAVNVIAAQVKESVTRMNDVLKELEEIRDALARINGEFESK